MKPTLFLFLLAMWPAAAAVGQAEQALVEAERIVHCGPSTQVAVFQSGVAYERIKDGCLTSTDQSLLHRLRPQDVQDLVGVVAETRFFDLPSAITPMSFVTDEDVFILRVRVNGREHAVTALGLERAKDRDAADRFTVLWRAVASLATEPN